MADYSISNQFDPLTEYKKGLTTAVDREAQGMNLSKLAREDVTAGQTFQDQQSQRQAMAQNVGTSSAGETQINKPAAIQQLYKENPAAAPAFEQMMNKLGIDKAAQHADRMNEFWRNVDDSNFQQEKKKLIDEGYEEGRKLPDVFMPSMKYNGLMSTGTAAQQMEMMKQNALLKNQRDIKLIEEGYVPDLGDNAYHVYGSDKSGGKEKNPHLIPNLPPEAQGLPPGSVIPAGKRDMQGQKAYDDSLSQRKLNDPSYAQAENDLYATKKAMSIFNSEKNMENLNNISTQESRILAGEMAKIIKGGGSPTEKEVDDMMPENIQSKGAEKWAAITSKPVPTNNAEYYAAAKDYFMHLRDGAMNKIASANQEARQNAIAAGISPKSLETKHNARMKMLNESSNVSPKGQEERVVVIDPSGKEFHLPKRQLEQALQQGYKQK